MYIVVKSVPEAADGLKRATYPKRYESLREALNVASELSRQWGGKFLVFQQVA